jgi:hypothetical protein
VVRDGETMEMADDGCVKTGVKVILGPTSPIVFYLFIIIVFKGKKKEMTGKQWH